MQKDKTGAAGADRRRHRRVPIHLEAVLEGDRPEDTVRLTVIDFSVGGFFCRISRSLPVMTRLAIRFEFPAFGDHTARGLDAQALVVRCQRPQKPGEEYKLAAAFLDLPPQARDHIQAYVDWYEAVQNATWSDNEEAREAAS